MTAVQVCCDVLLADSPPAAFFFLGARCGGDVTTTWRHTTSSPRWRRCLWGGPQPGIRSTSGLPAGRDEADDGDGAGEEGADAHDGAAETAALKRAETAAAATLG